jgi:hypothetical protein
MIGRVRWLLLTLLVGCYAPKIVPGSPCDELNPCPTPLVCASASSTCQPADDSGDAGAGDATGIDSTSPSCADDPSCIANDGPEGAIDVTDGGTFDVDMLLAHDDAPSPGCGGDGGRDIFYTITLSDPQVYYFDTFGSDHDTSVRVFKGVACDSVASVNNPACNDDSCGGSESQLATSVPAGTSCVVIDSNSGATTGGLTLHVIPGGRNGLSLGSGIRNHTGNTCNSTNISDPVGSCGGSSPSPDDGYFFTICHDSTRTLDASTCATLNTFDTMIYVHEVGVTNDLDCNDDDNRCGLRAGETTPDGSVLEGVSIPGPKLGWLIVDGYSNGACGDYALDTNLN